MLKLVCISDSHSYLNTYLPKGDVLIMAGDMEPDGNPESQANWMHFSFRKWLNTVAKDFRYKLYTFGNHSWWCDEFLKEKEYGISGPYTELVKSLDMHILINGRIDIDGYSFFVSPYCNRVGKWNWGLQGDEWDIVMDKWPKTDVLVTHGPPAGVLDHMLRSVIRPDGSYTSHTEYTGSMELYRFVEKNRPKAHIFGHIHPHQGQKRIDWTDEESTVFVNAAQVNDNRDAQFSPIEVFLP